MDAVQCMQWACQQEIHTIREPSHQRDDLALRDVSGQGMGKGIGVVRKNDGEVIAPS